MPHRARNPRHSLDGLQFLLLCAVGITLAFTFAERAAAVGADPPDSAAAPTASNTDPAVRSGAKALQTDDHFPWYDAEHDALRPVVLRTIKDGGQGDSKDFNSRLRNHHGRLSHGGDGSGHGSGGKGSGGGDSSQDNSSSPGFSMPAVSAPWLIWVAWIVIGGVLVFLVVMLIRAFLNREARKAKTSEGESIAAEDDDDRLDALPIPAARPKGTLLEEARRSYETGDYNSAIVYLYSYHLLRLDQNQWIRVAKGKTNRQYLRELSGRGELQAVLARAMVPFEDVYFGNHSLDRARFEACWNDVERFDRLVERTSP